MKFSLGAQGRNKGSFVDTCPEPIETHQLLICSIIITQPTHALIPHMALPCILLLAVHLEGPTCIGWKGDWSELGHSCFSFELMKRNEVMILYYDTEGYIRRIVVKWLLLIPHDGRARRGRMKSFQF